MDDESEKQISTVRSSNCLFLSNALRCTQCRKVRHVLCNRYARNVSRKPISDMTTSNKPNSYMNTREKTKKLKQLVLKNKIFSQKVHYLQEQIGRLKARCSELTENDDEQFTDDDNCTISS